MADNNSRSDDTGLQRIENDTQKSETTSTSPASTSTKRPVNNLAPLSLRSPVASPKHSRTASPSRPQPLGNPIATQPSAAAIQRALSAANAPQLQGPTTADGATKLPRPPKSAGASAEAAQHWPTSPRLKSPPPSESNSRRGSATVQKKAEPASAPSISVQSATPQASTPPSAKQGGDQTTKGSQLTTPAKATSRGASGKSTLETVQENSTDEVKEPTAATQASADLKPLIKSVDHETQTPAREAGVVEAENLIHQAESGSESAGTKSPRKKEQSDTSQRPRNAQTKSYASLASTKSRQSEGKQNMTVETETVPSIPQSALNVGDRSGPGRGENSGSIKQKPSSETIRPKKERKKTTHKARSINQGTGTFYIPKSPLLTLQTYVDGTADDSSSGSSRSSSTAREVTSGGNDSPRMRQHSYSQRLQRSLSLANPTRFIRSLSNKNMRKASSKADIFEQRVANAVDEANSSDSDETFVYESNPIEPRRSRHHSRTPSVGSSHSVADQQRAGIRNFGEVLDERRVAGKRSMKFSNNAYNESDTPDGKDGSVRSHTPRHFGRFGRGGSQQSMFDADSPFTQASKLRSNQGHSGPNSPRSPQNSSQQQQRSSGLFGRKGDPSYDFDAEVGDDERTPLVGTVRTPRGARLSRRINRSPSIDEYYGVRRHGRCGRFGGCWLALMIFLVVLFSMVGFLFMSNRPLYGVKILHIENVLASEQELMLDLCVEAVNPNALGIAVTDMDINIFAKSKHVGSGGSVAISTSKRRSRSKWRARSAQIESTSRKDDPNVRLNLSDHWHTPTALGGVDEGTDPPEDDPSRDAQTMLLGRIFYFDQALTFEGSPLKRHEHNSTGTLRLEKPGNQTETGGSERWERVLQNEFELILRGLLRYQLPISGRMQTVAVGSSRKVDQDDIDGSGHYASGLRGS